MFRFKDKRKKVFSVNHPWHTHQDAGEMQQELGRILHLWDLTSPSVLLLKQIKREKKLNS